MRYRIILSVVTLMSAVLIFADRKLTVSNQDTGEELEVTVPDGLRIYHINQDWLDSIPYLQEHARYNEPWAYKAIGDCFRYGKGTDKSLINAILFYEKSNHDVKDIINEDSIGSSDNLPAFYDFFNNILSREGSKEYLVSEIDNYQPTPPEWMEKLREILDLEPSGILDLLTDDDTEPDDLLFGIMSLRFHSGGNSMTSILGDNSRIFNLIDNLGTKLPIMADGFGELCWGLYKENMSENLLLAQLAVRLSYYADRWGCLSDDNRKDVLDFYDGNAPEVDGLFTQDDLERMR